VSPTSYNGTVGLVELRGQKIHDHDRRGVILTSHNMLIWVSPAEASCVQGSGAHI
jgi:hypothetical protein